MSNEIIPQGTKFSTITRGGNMTSRNGSKWEFWEVVKKNGPNCYECRLTDSTEYNFNPQYTQTFGELTILAGTKKPVDL